MMKSKFHGKCCGGFPVFAVILLLIGIVWLLNDLGYLSVDIPWIPLIVIGIAVKILICRQQCK